MLPAGAPYAAHVRRIKNNLTFEEDDRLAEEERKAAAAKLAAEAAAENDLGVGDEEETLDLLELDPKEWKASGYTHLPCFYALMRGLQTQDHYAVLGLSKFRYKATEEQIRIARTFRMQFLDAFSHYYRS